MNIIEQITDDVAWLKSNIGSNDLNGKLEATERLAINSLFLAQMVGDAHEKSNNAEFFWKSAQYSYVANNEGGVSKLEAKAKDYNKNLYKEYTEHYNAYKTLSLLLGQVNIIIEQSRQSIAQLRKEYER